MEERRTEPSIVAVAGAFAVKSLPAHPANYARVARRPSHIIIHCTDGHEGYSKDFDEAVAISKALPKGKQRSFHYVVDGNSATQCVDDKWIAWHARARGNAVAIGVELCGRAAQTREQWFDAVSLATMSIAARLCSDICERWGIPPVAVDADGLLRGEKGITTHAFVSKAWKQSNHWDPGPHFPFREFVEAVARAKGRAV